MSLASLDLNLLVVFDAVARERSATRAAARLNTTQSAVSHALSRLRAALGDDLFVRTPNGMEPTPYAASLIHPVGTALLDLESAVAAHKPFEAEFTSIQFRIALDNRCALVMAPPLAALAAAEAPRATLDFRPSGTLDVATSLDEVGIDLALGSTASPADRFNDLLLFEDRFVALVRRGHPACRDGTIGIDALATHPHLGLSSTGDDAAFVDAALATQGRTRRVGLRAPLLASPAILAESDLIAIVGERTAGAFVRYAPLIILDLPFPSPTTATAMLWHRRLDDAPSHRWLRDLVLRASRQIRVVDPR